MHGIISRNDNKSGPSRRSENEIPVASPRRAWSARSGVLLVVMVVLVSGFLGQMYSDALDPDGIARPTVSEVAIRNLWFGRNFFSPVRTPDIQGGDSGRFSALSASETVQSGNAVEIVSDLKKSADNNDDSPAAVSSTMPRVTLLPDPANLLVATAEPSSSLSELSDSVGAPPVPPASTREVVPRSSSGLPKAGNGEVGKKARQGEAGEDGTSKNRMNEAIIEEDGKKSGHAIEGKSQPGNPPSARIAEKQTNVSAQGSNPAPGVVSSAVPPVPSLAEGDIPIFGDWDQPIPWTSPYATDVAINMADEPLCKGVVSVHPPHPNARRVFIIMPRFGLGNAMRGYLSSIILALLSGRQMVLFHGGPHASVFDRLCTAFQCGFESIHWEKGGKSPTHMWRELARKKGVYSLNVVHDGNMSVMFKTLHSDLPIFASMSHDFFDNYWMNDEQRRICVFAATNCVTHYCVQSRVARLFLKDGPTDRVAQSIKAHLRSKAPSSPKHQLVTAHIDKNYYFDLSIHIRTQSLRVEGADRKCRTEECMAQSIADTDKAFSDESYWGCIDLLIRTKLAALLIERDYTRVTTEGWRIYLATDDIVLRPLFLNRLSHHGRVFYMAAETSHFARGPTAGKDPMPTLADFFLIGRAHIMIEGREKLSSFAQFPALMTNASFATLNRRGGACKFDIKHEGFNVHSV